MNTNIVYVQYKVNVSEKQVDTLKDAIRLKEGGTLCLPKGCIRDDHVPLLTPPHINGLDRAQAEGRRVQIRMSARQVAKNVSYTGGFSGMLASLAACALPTLLTGLTMGLLSGGISKVQLESMALKDPKVPLGRLVKWDLSTRWNWSM